MNTHDDWKRFHSETTRLDSRRAIRVHDDTSSVKEGKAESQRETDVGFANVIGAQQKAEEYKREQEAGIRSRCKFGVTIQVTL